MFVPAGDYRLYLITDGDEVTVTLRLHGLQGKVVLNPTQPAKLRLENATPQISGEPAVYSAGRARRLSGRALGFVLVWSDPGTTIFSGMGTCQYRGGPPVPDPVAYGRLCGDMGAGGIHMDGFGSAIGPVGLWWVDYWLTKGRWGQGGYVESVGEVKRIGVLLLWLTYE